MEENVYFLTYVPEKWLHSFWEVSLQNCLNHPPPLSALGNLVSDTVRMSDKLFV